METVEKIGDRLERKFNFEKLKPIDRSILSLVKNANKETMEENSNKNAVVVSTQRDLIAGEC